MARLNISEMEKIEKNKINIHEEVASTYSTFVKGNERYFQIDMYGSKERIFTGKVSQVIQLDKENAKKLIDLLKEVFNI